MSEKRSNYAARFGAMVVGLNYVVVCLYAALCLYSVLLNEEATASLKTIIAVSLMCGVYGCGIMTKRLFKPLWDRQKYLETDQDAP